MKTVQMGTNDLKAFTGEYKVFVSQEEKTEITTGAGKKKKTEPVVRHVLADASDKELVGFCVSDGRLGGYAVGQKGVIEGADLAAAKASGGKMYVGDRVKFAQLKIGNGWYNYEPKPLGGEPKSIVIPVLEKPKEPEKKT